MRKLVLILIYIIGLVGFLNIPTLYAEIPQNIMNEIFTDRWNYHNNMSMQWSGKQIISEKEKNGNLINSFLDIGNKYLKSGQYDLAYEIFIGGKRLLDFFFLENTIDQETYKYAFNVELNTFCFKKYSSDYFFYQKDQKCMTLNQICNSKFLNSYSLYTGDISSILSNLNNINNGEYNCKCNAGYISNTNQTACVKYEPKCGLNSGPTSDGKCSCNSGYTWQDPNDDKNFDCIKKEVVKTPDQLCQDSYGLNSVADGKANSDGTYNCNCKTGYVWNTNQTACIEEVKVETQKKETYNLPDNLIVKIDTIFEKIKLSKVNLTDQQKTKFYEKLDKQLDQMYAKQKKEQNKNIINYLKSLVKIELDNLGSLDDLFGDLFGDDK